MTKKERETLLDAIDSLERNPCEWEDAMSGLYALAGLIYRDHRKIVGVPITVTGGVMNIAMDKGE